MSVAARCFQCKEEVQGSVTGQRHATLTGHTWQPGYYCTSCEAMFEKHSECEQHILQFGGHCKRAPTKPSTTSIHRSSSSSASGRSPFVPGGRGSGIGVAALRPGMSPSSVSEPLGKVRVSYSITLLEIYLICYPRPTCSSDILIYCSVPCVNLQWPSYLRNP